MCYTRVHAATIQTRHDMLERDFKVMKDNYDKICSENRQLNALFTRQQKDKEKRRARDKALKAMPCISSLGLTQSVHKRQFLQWAATPTVSWPPSGTTPVNMYKFNTEDIYISCAFPTLFPTGAADYNTA